MGVLNSPFAWGGVVGVGNSPIKKLPGDFAGGWSGLELTDT